MAKEIKITDSKPYRLGRKLYHAEAAAEYLIALLMQGSFLAYLTSKLGISDSLTGIISSIISLGCLFQLVSIWIRPKGVKRLVIWLSITNQVFFLSLYILPLGDRIPTSVKTVLFVAIIVVAYFLYNVANPKKLNWLMSLVPDAERGRFTAIKEIISLVSGIIFSYVMGQVIDRMDAAGNARGAFLVGALVILALTILHTTLLIFVVEPKEEQKGPTRSGEGLKKVLGDKSLRRVVLVFVLWGVANQAALPFYGSYQIKELALSQTTIALMVAVSHIVRIACSIPMGVYADRVGFAKMLRLCLLLISVSFGAAAVARPGNVMIPWLIYYIFQGIAMSGISSSLMNLVFDFVPHSDRANAFALTQAVSGVVGFLTALAVSPLITYVQSKGNQLFGLPIYAQQITSLIAVVMVLLTVIYLHFRIIRKQK